ncbi:MAG: NifB/NifX family molybdenum-iron cluster-binding protein [candidate division Zixibacteria bacterium]|nr:NifB/NifX family molybdenum-iron cluster-binding protein [candidate division Zixibacteria bacterium]
MKIAISSKGKDMSSPVDPHFGRAAYFIVYDSDNQEFEAISNTDNVNAAQGAGIQAAQSVSNKKAEFVISGHIGPKAFSALRTAGIKVVTWHDGSVQQAVDLFLSNELTVADGANVNGHWKQ